MCLVIASVIGCMTPVASSAAVTADTASVPRLIPTFLPEDFVPGGGSVLDWAKFGSHVHYLATKDLRQQLVISAYPRTKSEAVKVIDDHLAAGGERLRIRNTRGVRYQRTGDNNIDISWYEKGRLFTIDGVGVSRTFLPKVASNIVIDRTQNAAFTLSKMPSGFHTAFAGPIGQMITLDVNYEWRHPDGRWVVFRLRRVAPQFRDIELTWYRKPDDQFVTVRGTQAQVFDKKPYRGISWAEGDYFMDINTREVGLDELVLVAQSIRPVDESTWSNAFTSKSDTTPTTGPPSTLSTARALR
jgi:hypothetical protein